MILQPHAQIYCKFLCFAEHLQNCLQSYAVHVIQVKVHLRSRMRLRLKLMSVMTGQCRICVQCVTNGLQRNKVWPDTEKYTLEWYILVVSVRKSFHLGRLCVSTWIFMLEITNAQYVANVVKAVIVYHCTDEVIQERNYLSVLFATSNFHHHTALLYTAEFTVERKYSNTNVTCVTRRLVSLEIWTLTWESTRVTNHTNVHCVTKVSLSPAACSHMDVMYTVTVDLIYVLSVGNCLRQTGNWSYMFVFTLMQSRTHVDTVLVVLHGLINSRDICWSHTMKVLDSHVTFVSRNSP